MRRRLQGWPILLWICLVLVCFMLYQRSAEFGRVVGVVETIEEPVAPLETARLNTINVTLGQRVKAGDELARMDATLINGEIAVNRALLAEAEETITGYQQNLLQMVAQADRMLSEAITAMETEKSRQASQAAELATLRTEQERRNELFKQHLINERDLYELKPQIASLEQEAAAAPALLATYQQRVDSASKQIVEAQEWLRVEKGASISEAIRAKMKARNAVFLSTIEMLQTRASTYTLRAAHDGVVSQILLIPGNVVNAGTPILTLVAEHPKYVIGFLPEVHLGDLPVGQKALVWRSTDRAAKTPALVTSIAPDVRALPARISPVGNQPIRGRRVVLELRAEHNFIPGETVEINSVPPSLKEIITRLFQWRPL